MLQGGSSWRRPARASAAALGWCGGTDGRGRAARTGGFAATRFAVVTGLALVLVATLAACGVAKDPLTTAASDLAATQRSAAVALRLAVDGRTLPATARTQVDDAATDAADALHQAAALSAPKDQAGVQREVLEQGAVAVSLLRTAARAGVDDPDPTLVDRLERQAETLDALADAATGA